MSILVIAEHDNQHLKSATRHALTAASHLGKPIHVLVAGLQCMDVANEAGQCEGVEQVWLAEHEAYAHGLPENMSPLIAAHAKAYTHIIAAATTFGKQLMPRVAALLGVEQVSDVIRIVDRDAFIRPIYAGNALETIKSDAPIKVVTIRPTAFPSVTSKAPASPIETLTEIFENKNIRFIKLEATQSTRPELSNARVVIAGGRALQSAENFQLLEAIADKLNAAIGASRAAVDAGFVPNDYQVGQTGKVVAPDLYIAVGISGAIQHLAGMKDSKVIVAINKDPEAPIFQVADYGLVGDLFAILPELEVELNTLENNSKT
jgi:electron transfer flavoprotein alpha subunit